MTDLGRQDANREKGESRTQAILSDAFWVLKRYVDVEGADFLLQIPAKSLDELWDRKRKLEVIGVVQSKYFEERNQVKISKKYVEDESRIYRSEFFAFLHTNDAEGEDVHYFFTASEIQKEFYLNNGKNCYCFSITNNRDYNGYRNLKKRIISDKITDGILKTQERKNKELVNIMYCQPDTIYSSENIKSYETESSIHELRQVGNRIEIVKKSKSSGVETIIGTTLGNIKNTSYDPITGVTSCDFEDL